MTPADVIRKVWPDADAGASDHILWGRTAFPFERMTARKIYEAADRLRRATEHGIRLCDHCDRPAIDEFTCDLCAKALNRS